MQRDDNTLDSNDDDKLIISKLSDYESSNEDSTDEFFSNTRTDA